MGDTHSSHDSGLGYSQETISNEHVKDKSKGYADKGGPDSLPASFGSQERLTWQSLWTVVSNATIVSWFKEILALNNINASGVQQPMLPVKIPSRKRCLGSHIYYIRILH